MTSEDVFAYLERIAKAQPEIAHDEGKRAFYVIEDGYDTDEFDKALRNFASFPAMLTEDVSGVLDDNQSANYTDTFGVMFMIVDKREGNEPVRAVRNRCKEIGKRIVYQIRKDRNSRNVVPDKFVSFDIAGVNYQPVGPMHTKYYGYQFLVEFIVPFSFV